MSQNIFDNDLFFCEYMKLRGDKNYNDLLEQPAMARLLPDLRGKTILDIGCGYGHNSLLFAQKGAKRVVGIDISQKMLRIAQEQYHHPCVEYRILDMARIGELTEKFDVVYSSLAFHYAEDFAKLVRDIYDLLNESGILLYSQEHPIVTATMDGRGHHNLDAAGAYESYTFSDYAKSGKRADHWFVDGVVHFHRPMGEIVSALAHTGFYIEELIEPLPDQWALREKPDLAKEWIKPTFLIVRARKQGRTDTVEAKAADKK